MIHAVIFDMDGLMFDTKRLTYRGYQKAANEMGFTFPLELFKQMCGLSVRKSQELFQKWFNKEFDFLQTDTICSAYVKSYLSRQTVCGDEVQKGKPNPEISRLCSYICDDLLQVMDVLKKER